MNGDVFLETFSLVVATFRLGDTFLVTHKLGNLLIERVFSLGLRLCSGLDELTRLELTVLVSLASIDACEWVQEVFVFDDT